MMRRDLVLAHPMMTALQLDAMCRALQWVGAPNGTEYKLHVSSLLAIGNDSLLNQWKEQGLLTIYPMVTASEFHTWTNDKYRIENDPVTLADRTAWTYIDICHKLQSQTDRVWISKWGIIPVNYESFERALFLDRVIGDLTMDSSCRECMKQHYASQINVVEYARAHSKPTVDHDWGAPFMANVQQFVELASTANLRCFDPLNLYAAWFPNNPRVWTKSDPSALRLVSPSLLTGWAMNGRPLDYDLIAIDHRLWPAALDQALPALFR